MRREAPGFRGHHLLTELSRGIVWPWESPMGRTPMLRVLGWASQIFLSSPLLGFWGWLTPFLTHPFLLGCQYIQEARSSWLAGNHSGSFGQLGKLCSDLFNLFHGLCNLLPLFPSPWGWKGVTFLLCSVVPLCLSDHSVSTKLEEGKKAGWREHRLWSHIDHNS